MQIQHTYVHNTYTYFTYMCTLHTYMNTHINLNSGLFMTFILTHTNFDRTDKKNNINNEL